jgi:hypothetical protein
MVSASVLLMVTLGGIGINRVRHARRFRAVIDAYANEQIAQERKTVKELRVGAQTRAFRVGARSV